MKKLTIKMADGFYDMLRGELIKKSWTMTEEYGIDAVLQAMFEEELEYEDIGVATHKNFGVLEAFMYDGFFFGDVHINRAYIHENNDIILLGEGENMLILENDYTCICKYNS